MPRALPAYVRWLAAPILGAVTTAGFAPYDLWLLALLAVAALLWLVDGQPWRRAAALGWLFGFTHFLGGVYWVYISTHVFGGAPAWLSVILASVLCSYLALYPALALGLCVKLGGPRAPRAWFAFPALWLLAELLRGGWVFGGFPWLSLGEMSVDTPLANWLPLSGVHGVSALLALTALALFRLLVAVTPKARVVAAIAALAPLLGALLPAPSSWTQADGAPVTVSLVQSNIRQDEKWKPEMRYEALVRHARLTEHAWPADLVIWPEVALTQPYHLLREGYLRDLHRTVRDRGATLLLGILIFEEDRRYNSVISLGADVGRYDKRHLVPFGEFFPIPDFLRPLMDVLGTPYSDFTAGDVRQERIAVGGRPVAVGICFEDVFGDEVRRDARAAGYLVNVTNDAWFEGSSAPYQHLVFSRLRAIENGRWMARVANTGISALIDPDGRIVAQTPQYEQKVLKGELQPRQGLTPYQRWGDLPMWLLASVLAATAFWRHRNAGPGGSN